MSSQVMGLGFIQTGFFVGKSCTIMSGYVVTKYQIGREAFHFGWYGAGSTVEMQSGRISNPPLPGINHRNRGVTVVQDESNQVNRSWNIAGAGGGVRQRRRPDSGAHRDSTAIAYAHG